MNPADLETLQHVFTNALLDVNDVDPALAKFKGNSHLNRERFAYYRGNLIAIWQQTCANAYPVLQQLVGEEFFNDLSRAYGLTHGSHSGNLAEFGASLADFISTLENCQAYPYLSDIAALEWQVHHIYYAEQCSPFTLAQLSLIPPEHLSELRFKLQDTCALLKSTWAIADIWHAHQNADATLPQKLSCPTQCLIWRDCVQYNFNIQVTAISCASYVALQALAAGETLGQALELALAEDPQFEFQTELASWFNKALFKS